MLSGKATDYAKQRMLQQGYELTGDGDFRHKSAKINPYVLIKTAMTAALTIICN